MGGDGYKSALKDSMYVEKKKRDGEKGSGGEEHEHKSEAHSEAHAEEHAKPQTPNTVGSQGAATDFSARNMLADFSPAIKAAKDYADAVEHLQTAVEKMDGATKAALASEIEGAQQAMAIRKAELDPINKMTTTMARRSPPPPTRPRRNRRPRPRRRCSTPGRPRTSEAAAPEADRDEAAVRAHEGSVNQAKSNNDSRRRRRACSRRSLCPPRLTQTDKDRLAVEQQIANLARDKTYTQAQLDQLKQILELTKQIERENQQFQSLNPQASALRITTTS